MISSRHRSCSLRWLASHDLKRNQGERKCVATVHKTGAPNKERAGEVQPAHEVWLRMHSEDNLQRQLGIVRLARTDAGRAVRDADGLGARPEQGTVSANARTTGVSR